MKRIAIVIYKNLNQGEIGNVSAILMGQQAMNDSSIFSSQPVFDKSGVCHAGIRYSTVVLKAGEGQLYRFIQLLKESNKVEFSVFSKEGQKLNNQFDEYRKIMQSHTTEELSPVGVILSGTEEEIKQLTKKFSLLK